MPRRDKRRYGRTAKDVRRGGLGTRSTPVSPTIKDLDAWIRVNGSDVANTNSIQSMTSTSEREVMTFTHVVELEAGDYFELLFMVNDLNVVLNNVIAGASNPATPSVIANIERIR